jgi:vancomycin resistance protein YoaR
MTTLSQPLPRAFGTLSSLLRWPPLLAFGVTFATLLMIVTVAAAGYAHVHRDAVFPGVTVSGVAVGGLDRSAAEAQLRSSLPPLATGFLSVRLGDTERRIAYAELGRDYGMAEMLENAYAVGRAGGPFVQAGEQLRTLTDGVDVKPIATWNARALDEAIAALGAAAAIAPRDADVVSAGFGYRVVAAQRGLAFDLALAREQATAVLSRPVAGDVAIAIEPTILFPQVETAVAQQAVDSFGRVVESAFAANGGGTTLVVDQSTIRSWVRLERDAMNGGWRVAVDDHAIAGYLADMAVRFDRTPAEAGFELTSSGVVATPSVTGQSLIVDQSAQLIRQLLETRAAGGSGSGLELSVVSTEPALTTAEALDFAQRVELVSSWTTRFIPGPNNFNGKNIALPARLLNGTVVTPGERFSFLDAVGEISARRGFGPGGAIIRGRTNPTGAIGGGICSASTTLFNAALRGGYDIVSRTQHSYSISRYPVGLDATVFRSGGSETDMVFVNDSEYPLWIRGINHRGRITFEIWTVPDGRTVKIYKPRVENRHEAEDTVEYVSTLAPGVSERVEYPVDGYDSWVTRVVRDAAGRTLHNETYFSHYITVTGLTQVGITPDVEPPPTEPPPEEPPPDEEPPPTP